MTTGQVHDGQAPERQPQVSRGIPIKPFVIWTPVGECIRHLTEERLRNGTFRAEIERTRYAAHG